MKMSDRGLGVSKAERTSDGLRSRDCADSGINISV